MQVHACMHPGRAEPTMPTPGTHASHRSAADRCCSSDLTSWWRAPVVIGGEEGSGGQTCVLYCGPPGFNDAVRVGLLRAGHRTEQTHHF